MFPTLSLSSSCAPAGGWLRSNCRPSPPARLQVGGGALLAQPNPAPSLLPAPRQSSAAAAPPPQLGRAAPHTPRPDALSFRRRSPGTSTAPSASPRPTRTPARRSRAPPSRSTPSPVRRLLKGAPLRSSWRSFFPALVAQGPRSLRIPFAPPPPPPPPPLPHARRHPDPASSPPPPPHPPAAAAPGGKVLVVAAPSPPGPERAGPWAAALLAAAAPGLTLGVCALPSSACHGAALGSSASPASPLFRGALRHERAPPLRMIHQRAHGPCEPPPRRARTPDCLAHTPFRRPPQLTPRRRSAGPPRPPPRLSPPASSSRAPQRRSSLRHEGTSLERAPAAAPPLGPLSANPPLTRAAAAAACAGGGAGRRREASRRGAVPGRGREPGRGEGHRARPGGARGRRGRAVAGCARALPSASAAVAAAVTVTPSARFLRAAGARCWEQVCASTMGERLLMRDVSHTEQGWLPRRTRLTRTPWRATRSAACFTSEEAPSSRRRARHDGRHTPPGGAADLQLDGGRRTRSLQAQDVWLLSLQPTTSLHEIFSTKRGTGGVCSEVFLGSAAFAGSLAPAGKGFMLRC